MSATQIEINLTAAIVAVEHETPLILVAGRRGGGPLGEPGLPSGPFDPLSHRTFEIGLRAWVVEQTALDIGYVEQLYTFGDRGRHAMPGDVSPHVVSVGYLALTRRPEDQSGLDAAGASLRPWYRFFPWEDWRDGRPAMLDDAILPRLGAWAAADATGRPRHKLSRQGRLHLAFGTPGGAPWDEEKVLDRYELLYDAGLVPEAVRDGRVAAPEEPGALFGEPLRFDHRRILATAMGRLRAKLKYRPVVFEMMPPAFTLTALQRTVESISGRHLHKQNFRRLVEAGALVEPTGGTAIATGGRPAQLFRFRREVLAERPAPGLRARLSRFGISAA